MITIRDAVSLPPEAIFSHLLETVPPLLNSLPDSEELDASADIARLAAWAVLWREGRARITIRVYADDRIVAEYPYGQRYRAEGEQFTQYCEKVAK